MFHLFTILAKTSDSIFYSVLFLDYSTTLARKKNIYEWMNEWNCKDSFCSDEKNEEKTNKKIKKQILLEEI